MADEGTAVAELESGADAGADAGDAAGAGVATQPPPPSDAAAKDAVKDEKPADEKKVDPPADEKKEEVKYELTLPEKSALDPAVLERTAAIARARGLSPEQAQAAVDLVNSEVASHVDALL